MNKRNKRSSRLSPADLTWQESLKLIAATALWITVVLLVFRPYGLRNFAFVDLVFIVFGFAVVNASVLGADLLLLPRLLPGWFNPRRWTPWKGASWVIFLNSSVALANLVFVATLSPWVKINLQFLMRAEMVSATFVLVPLLFTTLPLRKRPPRQKPSMPGRANDPIIVLKDEKGRICMSLKEGELLFITAAQNYVEIVWRRNGRLERTLLRNSLKGIEQNVHRYPMLVRCHRAYIVNIRKTAFLKRNGYSYHLILQEESIKIPVSRRYLPGVKQRLS